MGPKLDKNLANDVKSIFVNTGIDMRIRQSFNFGNIKRGRSSSDRKVTPAWKVRAGINLIKLSLSASYLVILSGDVSLNPGPTTDPCEISKKGSTGNQRAVQCDECDLWFHAKCTGITNEEFKNIAQPNINWFCGKCLFPELDSSVSSKHEMNSFKSEEKCADSDMNIRLLRGFKIAHININRLVNKIDGIKELLSIYSFDILTITETWLVPDIETDEIYVPGYSTVRRDGQSLSKSCGGGTLIFVRDGILFVVKHDTGINKEFECIWLEIKRRHCKCLTLCCAYRPGDQNIDNFISYLDQCLNDVDLNNTDVVLTGYLNINYSVKRCSLRRKLDEFALKNNLNHIVCKPTRVPELSSSTIDLILVNNKQKVVQCNVLDVSLSDQSRFLCPKRRCKKNCQQRCLNTVLLRILKRIHSYVILITYHGT